MKELTFRITMTAIGLLIGASSTHAKAVEFTFVQQGDSSAIEDPLQLVIHTEAEFDLFWANHTSFMDPPPEVPTIDFNSDMVVAIFRGNKPSSGYSVNVVSIEEDELDLEVLYETSDPDSEGFGLTVITQPYAMVQLPKTDKLVRFRDAQSADVDFSSVDQGDNSGIEESLQTVIRSEEEFNSFWSRHHSDDSDAVPPSIDFSTDMIVAVFVGKGSGDDVVEIMRIEEGDGDIHVFYETSDSNQETIGRMGETTTPFHVVKVQHLEKPVYFKGSSTPLLDIGENVETTNGGNNGATNGDGNVIQDSEDRKEDQGENSMNSSGGQTLVTTTIFMVVAMTSVVLQQI